MFLVRHGHSENHSRDVTGGWTDLPLTELGLEQASRTAARLAAIVARHSVAIFSSDLRRAAMTANVIAARLAVPVTLDAGLRELNNGKAAGLTTEGARAIELPRTEPELDWIPYPGAESWRQMTRRLASCMERLARNGAATIVIVGHADAGTAIVKHWLRFSESAGALVHFVLDACSITELSEDHRGRRVLVRLNDTAHLRPND
jgi:probable phosphoglycerate mutase